MPIDQMQYFPLQRSLSILRRLQRESTDRISLMLHVQLDLGLDAYEGGRSRQV